MITRRQFLEDSMLTTAAAASVAAPVLAEEKQSTSAADSINVAVIGCGIRGKQHVKTLGPRSDYT